MFEGEQQVVWCYCYMMNIFQVFSTCGLFIFFINIVVKWTLNSIDRLSDKGNLIRHMFADGILLPSIYDRWWVKPWMGSSCLGQRG